MRVIEDIATALNLLDAGEVLAYPTEAVYGFGCDMFNEAAVLRILALKKREKAKGLIILVANWAQLWPLIDKKAVPDARLAVIQKSWPGSVTWIFPKSIQAPEWITGQHEGIAIRMTAHPIAHALCQHGPIVSTSANLAGMPPCREMDKLRHFFLEGIAGVVIGELGQAKTVSQVYDAVHGKLIRLGMTTDASFTSKRAAGTKAALLFPKCTIKFAASLLSLSRTYPDFDGAVLKE